MISWRRARRATDSNGTAQSPRVMARVKPLAELAERDATGFTAKVYGDIRKATGATNVNLFFRHLATIPGALEWAWPALRPGYRSGALGAVSESVRATARLPALPPILVLALRAAGVDGAAQRTLSGILESYNSGNSMTVVSLGGLHRLLDAPPGARHAVGAVGPAKSRQRRLAPRPVKLPPLIQLSDMPREVTALVRDMSTRNDLGEGRIIPAIYRHLAYWPGYLAIAATLLDPKFVDRSIRTATRHVVDSAEEIAGRMIANTTAPDGVDGPFRGRHRAALVAAVQDFSSKVAEMLTVGLLLREALPRAAVARGRAARTTARSDR